MFPGRPISGPVALVHKTRALSASAHSSWPTLVETRAASLCCAQTALAGTDLLLHSSTHCAFYVLVFFWARTRNGHELGPLARGAGPDIAGTRPKVDDSNAPTRLAQRRPNRARVGSAHDPTESGSELAPQPPSVDGRLPSGPSPGTPGRAGRVDFTAPDEGFCLEGARDPKIHRPSAQLGHQTM